MRKKLSSCWRTLEDAVCLQQLAMEAQIVVLRLASSEPVALFPSIPDHTLEAGRVETVREGIGRI